MTPGDSSLFGIRPRLFLAALLGSALLLLNPVSGPTPALAYSPITGVTVSVKITKSVLSGDAVYAKATVQGSGDYDHRVTWSLSPPEAGALSPTGLFISSPTFTGAAVIKATSVEAPYHLGTATVLVSAGSDALHVDRNNLAPGVEDGTALHPYRTIQGAIDHAVGGDTIKVAQGIYVENVVLPWDFGVLLLGGFQGNSAGNYALGQPGDFVNRSTDHINRVTTVQSPSRALPVVAVESYAPDNPKTYAVDGFTLTGGATGVDADGSGLADFFISQNLITDNGALGVGNGGGISAEGINYLILNNRIAANQSGNGGGLIISSGNPFLVQGNTIENNSCSNEFGGGVWLYPGSGLFTWNIVRGNRSGLQLNYGYGGGMCVSGTALELNRNVYADNQAKNIGGGIHIDANAVLRHELLYRNQTASTEGFAAGIFVALNGVLTLEHCTITGNTSAGGNGNGLFVRETAAAQVSNSIIWGNSGNQVYADPAGTLTMTYSNAQPFAGVGNLSVDPLFANPATDDYHLQSQRGRWDPATFSWVADALQSACIDAGTPGAAFGQEPMPHGSRTNMGVYGNTPEASKSLRGPITAKVLEVLLLS